MLRFYDCGRRQMRGGVEVLRSPGAGPGLAFGIALASMVDLQNLPVDG